MVRLAWLVVVLALLPRAAEAQVQEPGPPPRLSAEAVISVLTVGPGDEIYSHFGHIAIRVRDAQQGLDAVFGYGTFDFAQPYFVPKFVRGELDYHLNATPFAHEYETTRESNRTMIEQDLALTPGQRDALWGFLIDNLRPEKRYYRYRFISDNCSTRVRDALEGALGESLKWNFPPRMEPSFRQMLRPYLKHVPWLDLGIDLGLGLPTDRAATPREATFLPLPLMEAIARASIVQDGQAVPLMAAKRVLLESSAARAEAAATPWPAIVFWGVFAAAVAGTWWTWGREAGWMRRADALLLTVVGLTGAVALFLWVGSVHEGTRPNLNLLWAWPTHLVVGVMLWWRRAAEWPWVRWYFAVAAVVSVAVAAGWFVLPQHLPAAMWPVAGAVAVRMGARGWGREARDQKSEPSRKSEAGKR